MPWSVRCTELYSSLYRDALGVQLEDGLSGGVWRVCRRPGRILDRRKLLVPVHLQQRHALGQRERVEDEQLQLDALHSPK